MRVGFRTNIEEELISKLKIKAIEKKVNVNDILEKLISLYLEDDTIVKLKKKLK